MTERPWQAATVFPLIPGRLSFAAYDSDEETIAEIRAYPDLFFCSTDLQERYFPFCEDFGPVNIGIVCKFCKYLRGMLNDKRLETKTIVYYCSNDLESVSNTAFLLSAFLMLDRSMQPEAAMKPFNSIANIPVVPFRDASFRPSTFPLTILDCLRALDKAKSCNWFSLEHFDVDRYFEHDDPENGDVHVICPKFIAFRDPGQGTSGAETLPAETYIKLLRDLEVTTVVRLSDEGSYCKQAFEDAGMRHVDLSYRVEAVPSDSAVRQFLKVCEGDGVCAVHCNTGLGRTGTMIAVWMMQTHGFTAKEAIAWMRLVRPGCVIGQQQHYLQAMERRLDALSFPAPDMGCVLDGKNGPAEELPVRECCACERASFQ